MRGARVLIVEDEPLIATMLEDMLTDLGCVVVDTAAGLDAALRQAAVLDIDFCLLDMNLAGRTSMPVVDVLRRRGLQFIISTGLGQGGLPTELGPAAVLSKPFSLDSLTAAMARLKLAPNYGGGDEQLAS